MKIRFMVCLVPLLFGALGHAASSSAFYHSEKLVVVADLGKMRAVGLAVSADNRVFVSFPTRASTDAFAVAEVVAGELVSYPDNGWNAPTGAEHTRFLSPQALHVDAQNNLWVLDSRPASGLVSAKRDNGYFKLVKINLKTQTVEQQFNFEGLDKTLSSLNDVNVDIEHNVAYLSDPGQSAIVVLNLNDASVRTVLGKSAATQADPDLVLRYDGQEMRDPQGKPFRSNVNGIALTKDNRYLYFKPINAFNLFRIETRFLRDVRLDDKALEARVENLGHTGVSHGLIADATHAVYLTSSLDYSIKYLSPRGDVHTLVQDSRLLWPDSLGIGTDGFLYLTAAQFQKSPYWNEGRDGTVYPYQVYKVRLAF